MNLGILDKLKAYGFMALSIVLGVLLATQTWRLHTSQLREAAAVTTLANERSVASAAVVVKQETFRTTEQVLDTSASETRKTTNDQVQVLTARNDSLLARVRRAEANAATAALVSRTTAAAVDRQAAGGGAQPELLGQLGETDVREAGRADLIRLHLEGCYADYDRAQAALKALSKDPIKGKDKVQ